MKKIVAVLLIVFLILSWVVSLTEFGPVGKLQEEIKLGLDLKGGVYVVMEAQTDATGEELRTLMDQTQVIVEGRVNEMGLSEPVVTIEGSDRIRVELPGADDPDEAIRTIGRTAQLQFVLGDGSIIMDGSHVKNAGIDKDEQGFPAVRLEFDQEGAEAFTEATRKTSSGQIIDEETGMADQSIYIVLDDNIISYPRASEVISQTSCIITGNFTNEEVRELSMLIRGGALPAELKEVNAGIQAPEIGIDALGTSIIAGALGIALILILMLVLYKAMGFVANVALIMYTLLIFWILVALGSVLTLPGICGLILSIGMAVDANVIIFSRIREEIESGKTVRVGVRTGYRRALTTVIDAQVTTMIAGIVLYQVGNSSVRGFAMTLMIGIIVSLFTAVVVTQLFLSVIAETKTFGKEKFFLSKKLTWRKELPFIKHRKKFYAVSAAIIVIGIGVGGILGFNFGIDFTGGTMMQIEMHEEIPSADIEKILADNDVSDVKVVHAGENNTQVIIRTTNSIETEQRAQIMNAFVEAYDITSDDLMTMEQFGPSIGELMKKNAIVAVVIAALCMLVYIIIRFEWKFGLAAVGNLLHDVLILVAFYGIFRLTINSPFIAAILVVVGYSINDTIVVFDRIRENRRLMNKNKIGDLVDKSINQTIGRSLMTSITTIIAILPLTIMGGDIVRQYTVPLLIGMIAGTISSITIGGPLYYQLCSLVKKPKYVAGNKAK